MFESLNEYYEYLETDLGLQKNLNVSKQLAKLRDKTENEEQKKVISFEIFFNDFSFDKGKYVPMFGYENGDCYQNLSQFEDFEYIKKRGTSESLKNPKYKAKYNHLLWESRIKHIDFAKGAIDNYLAFLLLIELTPNDNLTNHRFSKHFMNAFLLCQKINYKKEEILDFLIKHLESNSLNGFQKSVLINFVSANGKKIPQEYLVNFFDYAQSVVDNQVYDKHQKEYLKILITLSKKLNKSLIDYHNKLGDLHIAESKKHEGSFVIHQYYLDSLKQYQLAGNKRKVEEVTVLIEKAKDTLNFKTIRHEETDPLLQKWYDSIDKITTELIEEGDSANVFRYLILSEDIFPKPEDLNNNIKSQLMELMSTMNFDINRNVDSKGKSGINIYNIYIQNFTLRHLWLVFSKGIKGDLISYSTIKEFLQNETWYSMEIKEVNSSGETEVYNWTEQLLPALGSYFTQSEIDLKTQKNNNSEYILSIDSMTLKFEGVLRAFSRLIGAQTIDIKDDGTQERISFEKLLENEKFKAVIPETDITFFKFLFTSDGINLRNNIAHCFYKVKNYSASLMWLLICAFLKLGNYRFEKQ
ncbi:DUF4209 domain-containing protein [Labilibacter sediminis]|nr:DUF4209 domain-containing protein [Labilibacter sediminis]